MTELITIIMILCIVWILVHTILYFTFKLKIEVGSHLIDYTNSLVGKVVRIDDNLVYLKLNDSSITLKFTVFELYQSQWKLQQ